MELVVGGEGEEDAEPGTQAEEDLRCRVDPHLRSHGIEGKIGYRGRMQRKIDYV